MVLEREDILVGSDLFKKRIFWIVVTHFSPFVKTFCDLKPIDMKVCSSNFKF